jgi:hypothetical protein
MNTRTPQELADLEFESILCLLDRAGYGLILPPLRALLAKFKQKNKQIEALEAQIGREKKHKDYGPDIRIGLQKLVEKRNEEIRILKRGIAEMEPDAAIGASFRAAGLSHPPCKIAATIGPAVDISAEMDRKNKEIEHLKARIAAMEPDAAIGASIRAMPDGSMIGAIGKRYVACRGRSEQWSAQMDAPEEALRAARLWQFSKG